jgi:hypothetical protein
MGRIGARGGGAVRISAGSVALNGGRISADGGTASWAGAGGGAGGSVWLDVGLVGGLQGPGLLSVNGGSGASSAVSFGGGGGGGRVAVHLSYNATFYRDWEGGYVEKGEWTMPTILARGGHTLPGSLGTVSFTDRALQGGNEAVGAYAGLAAWLEGRTLKDIDSTAAGNPILRGGAGTFFFKSTGAHGISSLSIENDRSLSVDVSAVSPAVPSPLTLSDFSFTPLPPLAVDRLYLRNYAAAEVSHSYTFFLLLRAQVSV